MYNSVLLYSRHDRHFHITYYQIVSYKWAFCPAVIYIVHTHKHLHRHCNLVLFVLSYMHISYFNIFLTVIFNIFLCIFCSVVGVCALCSVWCVLCRWCIGQFHLVSFGVPVKYHFECFLLFFLHSLLLVSIWQGPSILSRK